MKSQYQPLKPDMDDYRRAPALMGRAGAVLLVVVVGLAMIWNWS